MADATPGAGTPSSNRNVMILLSYLWLLALIPLVVEKDDREVQWHAKHGLVLAVAELIFWVAFQVAAVRARLGARLSRRDLRADHRSRLPDSPHRRDHQGDQRQPADRSRPQPVRRQVLSRLATGAPPAGAPPPHVPPLRSPHRRCPDRSRRLVVLDLRRAPADQLATRGRSPASTSIRRRCRAYYARMGVQCRFTPTCSHYGEACIAQFGVVRGGWMAAKRVVRCGPWTPPGTVDPPPARERPIASARLNLAPRGARVGHMGAWIVGVRS